MSESFASVLITAGLGFLLPLLGGHFMRKTKIVWIFGYSALGVFVWALVYFAIQGANKMSDPLLDAFLWPGIYIVASFYTLFALPGLVISTWVAARLIRRGQKP